MAKKRKTVMVQGPDGILDVMSSEDAKKKAKTEWLDEGAAVGARANTSAWEIGRWLVRGEQLFDEKPTGKRALSAYYAVRKEKWEALVGEAVKATNLDEASLRKCAKVVRRGVKVEGLSFSHHTEVMRAHYFVKVGRREKEKRQFDSNSATDILVLAKESNWTVTQTKEEVLRRFPKPNRAQDAPYKIRRIIKAISDDQKQNLIETLEAEIATMKGASPTPELFDEDGFPQF